MRLIQREGAYEDLSVGLDRVEQAQADQLCLVRRVLFAQEKS